MAAANHNRTEPFATIAILWRFALMISIVGSLVRVRCRPVNITRSGKAATKSVVLRVFVVDFGKGVTTKARRIAKFWLLLCGIRGQENRHQFHELTRRLLVSESPQPEARAVRTRRSRMRFWRWSARKGLPIRVK